MSGFLLVSTSKTWPLARVECASRGMQLAVVHDDAERIALNSLIANTNQDWWIGASDSFVEEGHWRWVDGSYMSYTYWGTGQPHDGTHSNEDCLLLMKYDNFQMHDAGCAAEHALVCSPLSPPLPPHPPLPPSPPPRPPQSPPPTLSPGGTSHYVLSSSFSQPDPGSLPWADAKAYCEAMGFDMGVVRSAADQALLVSLFQQTTGSTHNMYWIGLRREQGSTSFTWVDSSPLAYTNWNSARNMPTSRSGQDCVDMYGAWTWANTGCDGNRPFVCSRVALRPPPAPPSPPPSPPSPPPPPPSPGSPPPPQPILGQSGDDSGGAVRLGVVCAVAGALLAAVVFVAHARYRSRVASGGPSAPMFTPRVWTPRVTRHENGKIGNGSSPRAAIEVCETEISRT